MLINLWAENFDRNNSSQARKAWDDIAKKINLKFGTKRATEKFHKKFKYLIERYKICKDWNSKQTGVSFRKSAHVDESCHDILQQLSPTSATFRFWLKVFLSRVAV